MNKLFTLILTTLIVGHASLEAQSARYAPAMKSEFKMLKEAKTMQEHNSVSAAFNRIANAEKTLWVPYYYAALAKINGAMHDPTVDKDKVGAEVDSLLVKAELLEKNSELSTLHYYNEILKMSVNPAQRFMEASPLLEKYYQTAIAQDSANPRIYFMKGETVFHTPASFGGGKDAAKPLFQKAVNLFESQQPKAEFGPKWGKEDAEAMLKQCSE